MSYPAFILFFAAFRNRKELLCCLCCSGHPAQISRTAHVRALSYTLSTFLFLPSLSHLMNRRDCPQPQGNEPVQAFSWFSESTVPYTTSILHSISQRMRTQATRWAHRSLISALPVTHNSRPASHPWCSKTLNSTYLWSQFRAQCIRISKNDPLNTIYCDKLLLINWSTFSKTCERGTFWLAPVCKQIMTLPVWYAKTTYHIEPKKQAKKQARLHFSPNATLGFLESVLCLKPAFITRSTLEEFFLLSCIRDSGPLKITRGGRPGVQTAPDCKESILDCMDLLCLLNLPCSSLGHALGTLTHKVHLQL